MLAGSRSTSSTPAACPALAADCARVTHLVYAALHERPGLVAGWQEEEQIRTNDRMLRQPLRAPAARRVGLASCGAAARDQGLRRARAAARGPGAREPSEIHDQAKFYWNQERYIREAQQGTAWSWSILRPVLIVGASVGSAMNVVPCTRRLRRDDAARRQDPARLSRRGRPGRPGHRRRPAGARHRLVGQLGEGEERDLQRHQRRRLRVAEHMAGDRPRAGLRAGRCRAAVARPRDPPPGGRLGGDPRGARIAVRGR